MTLLSDAEQQALRMAPYVAELHEFLAAHGMTFGAPDDIPLLSERLSVAGPFEEQMASILRSVIYREGGALPNAELLELVATAAGGAHLEQVPPELRAEVDSSLRKISTFVAGAFRSRWNGPEDFDPSPDAIESVESHAVRVDPQSSPALLSDLASSEKSEGVAHLESPINPSQPAVGFHSDEIWDEHVAGVAFEQAPTLGRRKTDGSGENLPSKVAAAGSRTGDRTTPPAGRRAGGSTGRLWVLGVPALLLAFGAGLLLRSLFPSAQPAGKEVAATVTSVTKPSAGLLPVDPQSNSGNGRPGGSEQAVSMVPGKPVENRDSRTVQTRTYPPQMAPQSADHQRTDKAATISEARAGNTSPDTAADTASKPEDGAGQRDASPSASFPAPQSQGTQSSAPQNQAPQSTERPLRLVKPTRSSSLPHQAPFAVSSGIMAANLVSAPAPVYPKLAEIAHLEGQVILQAVISRSGIVIATHVLRGHYLLRGAAINAVNQWRYRPYVVNGHATDVATVVTVDFHRNH